MSKPLTAEELDALGSKREVWKEPIKQRLLGMAQEFHRQREQIRNLTWERDAYKDTLQSSVDLIKQAGAEREQLAIALLAPVTNEGNKFWRDAEDLACLVLSEREANDPAATHSEKD